MQNKQTRNPKRIIRSPVYQIPIGEPMKNKEGEYFLRIKKTSGRETEDVPLDILLRLVVVNSIELGPKESESVPKI